jgi:hypothetical protein
MRDDEGFRSWLASHKGIRGRSVTDISSRARRAKAMLGTSEPLPSDTLRLDKIAEFSECSTSVRSQVRRALRLWIEFSDPQRGYR